MLKFEKGVESTLSLITAITLMLMMLHIVAHGILRYFFSSPIYGTNEIVSYWYLPIVVLLGIPAAQLRDEHINVTLVTGRLSEGTAAIFTAFGALIGLLLCVGFAWFGLTEALGNAAMGTTAGVTSVISYPVYFLVPLVFGLLGILYLSAMVKNLRRDVRHAQSMTPTF